MESDNSFSLSSLYDQNFGEDDDDDEDDEVYGAEQEKMIGIIGKRTDWLPGDPEEEEPIEEVLIKYANGRTEWKYSDDLGENVILVDQYDEELGLEDEEMMLLEESMDDQSITPEQAQIKRNLLDALPKPVAMEQNQQQNSSTMVVTGENNLNGSTDMDVERNNMVIGINGNPISTGGSSHLKRKLEEDVVMGSSPSNVI